MNRIQSLFLALVAVSNVSCQGMQSAPATKTQKNQAQRGVEKPVAATFSPTTIVDEPVGARSSLGLTLWHMGHNADAIRNFHEFLKKRQLSPVKLLPASALKPPATTQRILLDPELLPAKQLNGWSVEGDYLTSSALDAGPSVDMPLKVTRAGLYRGWVRYYGWPTGTAVTSLRIYHAGQENQAPFVNDEIYDYAVEKEGPAWKEFMVDLTPGEYTVRLGHVTRQWQAGSGPAGYQPRRIDLLYFTDELWADAPSDEQLRTLRKNAPMGIQRVAAPALPAAQADTWKWWQVRPLSWEGAAANPRLFTLSRLFWRERIAALSAPPAAGAPLPDYRAPQRQIIFDDDWNLVSDPVLGRQRKETLSGDVITDPGAQHFYWLQAGDFKELGADWGKVGTGLRASYGDLSSVARTTLAVDGPNKYYVWTHFGNLAGYYAPWRVTINGPGEQSLVYDHNQKDYPSEWQRIGVLDVAKPGEVRFGINALPYTVPATYRNIYDFFLTTDGNYTPQGSVRPPIPLADYLRRARSLGAAEKDSYLAWLSTSPYAEPLAQEAGSDAGWPSAPVPKTLSKSLTMPANTMQAVQVGIRNLLDKPITFNVRCGPLQSAGKNAGKSYSGKVDWRVVGFVPPPGANGRTPWTPFALLRRPWITVPPRGVAGVWLTTSSANLPPGEYSGQVVLSAKGMPSRTVTLQVRVAPSFVPKQPVLVGGYTSPPEGEAYLRDYSAHGMKIWYGEMSKVEMQKRGIRALFLKAWETDEAAMRVHIERLKAMGLKPEDWVFSVLDEPNGTNEESLKSYIDVAKAAHAVDPKVRISFNPGEAASLATFKVLDPYCDFWLPYNIHRVFPPQEVEAKRAIFTAKPWMWYTTPCYWDKSPGLANDMYNQIRSVPAQPGDIRGTAFFALYYPFRDAWDTAHEYLPDVSVMLLPSRHGPVATPTWEAIRESIQHADLAQLVKEKAGTKAGEPAVKQLVESGSVADLVTKLEGK